MPTDVIMPVLGMNQDTAVLLAWRRHEGDSVTKGEPLMEVETDKATMELEAPASGTLARVTAADGEEVPVGNVIAVILAEGEVDEGSAPPQGKAVGATSLATGEAASATTHERPGTPTAPAGAAPARESPPRTGPSSESGGATPARPLASPKARRLAQERGVSLATLAGSGPDGAVLAADVPERPLAPGPQGGPTFMAGPTTAASWIVLEHAADAQRLSDTVAWAQGRGAASVRLGDLAVRFVAAVGARYPLPGAGPAGAPRVSYERVSPDGTQRAHLEHAHRLNLLDIAEARVDTGGAADPDLELPADIAVLDLTASAFHAARAGIAGTVVTLTLGRPHADVAPVDGVPTVREVLPLSFAFDGTRVDRALAVAWAGRILALVEDPSELAVLY